MKGNISKHICFIECKWQNSMNKEQILHRLIKKSKSLKHNLKENFLVICKKDFFSLYGKSRQKPSKGQKFLSS